MTELTAVVPGRDRHPGVRRGVPDDGVRGHLERPVRACGLHLVGRPKRLGDARERVVPDRRVVQVAPDVVAVGVAEAADRVVGGALGPDPQVAHVDLVRARDMDASRSVYGVRGPATMSRVTSVSSVGRREALLSTVTSQTRTDSSRPAAVICAVDLVALLVAVELAAVEPLAELVELRVLVLPEPLLAPAGHVAQPRRVEGVDAADVVALGAPRLQPSVYRCHSKACGSVE